MLFAILSIALLCDALHGFASSGIHVAAAKPTRRKSRRPNLFTVWTEAHASGNLPELDSPVRAPGGENSVALCTIMKDENSTDVREWLLYYRSIGVDHIYLTENSPTRSRHLYQQTKDLVDAGFLTYGVEPTPKGQTKVYRDCMKQHYAKHNWLMFFDLDEFLILTGNPEQSLPDFLDEYKEFAGLSVHWVIVGPSRQDRRPPAGGVMRTYDFCTATASPWIKTIANTFYLSNIAYHPHNFEFRDGRLTVDENKVPIPQFLKKTLCTNTRPATSKVSVPWAAESVTVERNKKGQYCTVSPGFRWKQASVAKVALFHYITRSREDYEIKRSRGGGSTKIRTWEEFNEFDRIANVNDGICMLPKQAIERCCAEESFVL